MMIKVDIQQLENSIQCIKNIFEHQLFSTGIWEVKSGLNLVAFNPSSQSELVTKFVHYCEKQGGFIESFLTDHCFIPFNGNSLLILIRHDHHLIQWLLLDISVEIKQLESEIIPQIRDMVCCACSV